MKEVNQVPDSIRTQKDILWGLYQEHRTHARHNEALRANAVNYTLVISTAIVTLIVRDGKIGASERPLGMILVTLGIFGALFSASYTVEFNRHRLRASECRKQLDKMFFPTLDGADLKGIRDLADNRNSSYFGFDVLRAIARAHLFWIMLPLASGLIGIYLLVVAY